MKRIGGLADRRIGGLADAGVTGVTLGPRQPAIRQSVDLPIRQSVYETPRKYRPYKEQS